MKLRRGIKRSSRKGMRIEIRELNKLYAHFYYTYRKYHQIAMLSWDYLDDDAKIVVLEKMCEWKENNEQWYVPLGPSE